MKRNLVLEKKITSILKKKFREEDIAVIYINDKRSKSDSILVFTTSYSDGEMINKTVECLRKFWNIKRLNSPPRNLWNKIIGRKREAYMDLKPLEHYKSYQNY